jgi:UrcA family protein
MTLSQNLTRILLSSGMTLAILVGAANAALAKDVTVIGRADPDVLTERVGYRDLDLTTQSNVRTLRTRVRGAVARVCQPIQSARLAHWGCISFARSGAEPQILSAIERANAIASTGSSALMPVTIVITAP